LNSIILNSANVNFIATNFHTRPNKGVVKKIPYGSHRTYFLKFFELSIS
jgi:hypothetical protein